MIPCPSCGSPIQDGDVLCRNCGIALSDSLSNPAIRTGRTLVIVSACITLGFHLAAFLFSTTAASLKGTLSSADCASTLVSGGLEVALLYLVFRGHSWARWAIGLLALAGTVLILAGLPYLTFPPALLAFGLVFALGMAMIAIIMLFVPSVPAFQRAQRDAAAIKKRSAA